MAAIAPSWLSTMLAARRRRKVFVNQFMDSTILGAGGVKNDGCEKAALYCGLVMAKAFEEI